MFKLATYIILYEEFYLKLSGFNLVRVPRALEIIKILLSLRVLYTRTLFVTVRFGFDEI